MKGRPGTRPPCFVCRKSWNGLHGPPNRVPIGGDDRPNGTLTKVQSRLKESRELLKKIVGHRAALAQLKEVATLLEGVTD